MKRRFEEHQSNTQKTAKYLRGKHPLTLACSFQVETKQEAFSIEWKIKQWPKAKKERLCNNENPQHFFSINQSQ